MLEIKNLSKNYGNFSVLKGVNLTLENGIYGLLAPNGAGKTTFMKILSTLTFPSQGEVLWNGKDIFQMDFQYRSMLGFLPQNFGYYRDYSPQKYLEYLAVLKGMKKEKILKEVDYWLEVVGLSQVKKKKMKKLSGGMIQRVGIAQALLNNPKILILDEPTAGLDPKERVRFRNILSELSKEKIIILSIHIVSDVESVANKIILLKDGGIFCNDTIPEITKTLDGKVYEAEVSQESCVKLQENYQILNVRQTTDSTCIRFVCTKGNPFTGIRSEVTLEDVFLYLYQ